MKTKLLSILAISVFFVFAACDDDDDSNNTTNNINNAECGNGIVEADEVCDGTALDGEDCTTIGDYTGGELACAADCSAFDESGCTASTNNAECGNGIVEAGEVCDGTALDGEDCTTIGDYTGGELDCTDDCSAFDESGCTSDATPTPDGFVGSSCADAADCTEVEAVANLTAECVQQIATFTLQDGYCSSTCDPTADPDPCVDADGECVDVMDMGTYQYCLQPCVPGNNECRTGYECAAFSQETDAPTYCLPPMK
ncbi:MAG: hypothetical protein ACQES9_02525 [Myxococcota bacterium]